MRFLPALLLLAACGDPSSPATDAQPVDAEVPDAEVPDAEVPDAAPPVDMATSADCELSLPCPTPSAGKVSVCGRLFDLETTQAIVATTPLGAACGEAGAATDGPCALALAFYDALDFAGNPGAASPLAVEELVVDDCGRFVAESITRPALGFIGVAIDDADGAADDHRLSGSAQAVTASGVYTNYRAYAARASTDAAWTTQAGLTGGSFATRGVIFARFLHATTPVAGVAMTSSGATRPEDTFYVTDATPGSHTTVAAGQTATGATGAALMIDSSLVEHSGQGGEVPNCEWDSELAVSIPGVVFTTELTLQGAGGECP